MSDDSKPFEVKVRSHLVKKCFNTGESVRIIQGNRAGESGIISTVLKDSSGHDSHAVITMINGAAQNDLTILVNNLRLK